MIAFGVPWALAAGAALAAATVLLHLFAPRPPARAPLPTARFLREDARSVVRPRRVPSDVPVLALRVAVALLLGALFAAPRWAPDREEGTTRIVLLDRGAGMDGVWEGALARASAEAEGRPGTLVVPFDTAPGEAIAPGGSKAPGEAIAAGGSDASERAGPTASETAGPTDHESSYLVALRALRRVALEETATTEVEAVLVSRPRWSAWDPQLAALRDVAWPGSIRVVDVGDPPGRPMASGLRGSEAAAGTPDSSAPASAASRSIAASAQPVAAVPDPRGRNRPAAAAFEVLGYQVVRDDAPPVDTTRGDDPPAGITGDDAPPVDTTRGEVADDAAAGAGAPATVPTPRVRFVDAAAASLRVAVSRAADGDTVVVFGAARPAADVSELNGLWDEGAWPEPPTSARTLRVGHSTVALTGAEVRAPGAAAPAPGKRLPIAWEDGAPAAGASNVGSGCVVRFGGPLDAGSADPDYPALIRTLVDGCRGEAAGGGDTPAGSATAAATVPNAAASESAVAAGRAAAPLDSAAIALLRGDGAASVAIAALGEPEGRSLEAWVLLAVALLGLAETALVASRRRAGPGPVGSGRGVADIEKPRGTAGIETFRGTGAGR